MTDRRYDRNRASVNGAADKPEARCGSREHVIPALTFRTDFFYRHSAIVVAANTIVVCDRLQTHANCSLDARILKIDVVEATRFKAAEYCLVRYGR